MKRGVDRSRENERKLLTEWEVPPRKSLIGYKDSGSTGVTQRSKQTKLAANANSMGCGTYIGSQFITYRVVTASDVTECKRQNPFDHFQLEYSN